GILVTNGRVKYEDIVVDGIRIETGAFTGSGVIPISVDMRANLGAEKTVTVNAKFSLSADQATEQVRLAGVNFSGMAGLPGATRPTHWEFTAPTIEANFKEQTLGVPSFAASYLGAQITGKLSATRIIDDLEATGSFKLDPLALREFLPRLGVE